MLACCGLSVEVERKCICCVLSMSDHFLATQMSCRDKTTLENMNDILFACFPCAFFRYFCFLFIFAHVSILIATTTIAHTVASPTLNWHMNCYQLKFDVSFFFAFACVRGMSEWRSNVNKLKSIKRKSLICTNQIQRIINRLNQPIKSNSTGKWNQFVFGQFHHSSTGTGKAEAHDTHQEMRTVSYRPR